MKYYLTLAAFLILSSILLLATKVPGSNASAQAPPQAGRDETLKRYEAVFKHPFDVETRKAYMASLPKVGDYYIVEGDIALTEQELRAYILASSFGARSAADDSAELIANVYSGRTDYYQDTAKRKLTYAVDRNSFADNSQYQLVVNSMAQAGKSWKEACTSCGVDFIYSAEFDANPSTDKVNFVVRSYNMGGALVALSFFPHDDASKRFINIDPSYFSPALKSINVGVLRHELGHVLGYRHEHIRPESGCYQGGEDSQWVALTSYDSNSVMHYFCRGDATNLTLDLTAVDKEGHRKLYGAAPAPATAPAAHGAAPVNPGGALSGTPAGFTLTQTSVARAKAEGIYKAAFELPFDDETIKAFMKSLPRDGDYYVVEGDLLLTEQELRSYLVSKSRGAAPADPNTPELIVNVNEGEQDYYKDPRKRDLTYVVDRASFPAQAQYEQVVASMQEAGSAWRGVCPECGVRFTHLKQYDGSHAQAGANFTVRYHDASGVYVAASFFPHDDASKRFLSIDPSYFDPQLQQLRTGVLRHELGHILGYRHEHTRGVAGCYQEDDRWQMLTPYDAQSVMHYFCGGGGNLKLELSQSDRGGHRKLYGTYLSAPLSYQYKSLFGPKLIVHLEGGNVVENAAKVLSVLTELNLVKLEKYRVDPGDTLESIYKKKLDLPFFSDAMRDLAEKLNRTDLSNRQLKAGQKVIYPDVDFSDYDFSIEFDQGLKKDRAKLDDLRANWKQLIKHENEKTGLVNVTLKGYELKIRVDSPETLERARGELQKLNLPSANVVILAEEKKSSNSRNVFFADDTPPSPIFEPADTFWNDYVILKKGKFQENIQGDLVLFSTRDRKAYRDALVKCGRGALCPTVILVDQPVDRHPDIADALVGGNETQGPKELLSGSVQQIDVGNYDGDSDHGTFMAGIIASQDNKFGLVGLDPGVRLVPFTWMPNSRVYGEEGVALEREIQRRDSASGLPIFVFASGWDYNHCGSAEDMINGNPVSRKIRSLQTPLWVVAAGQTKTDKGDDIGPGYCHGPMNLGYLPNVLVVTAYSSDANGTPHLLPDANYSTQGDVHVAAPGSEIVSTMRFSQYARMGGTSPATAFVAGVAAAMADTWGYYQRADRVKFRLQLTSTPSFEPQDAKRVAAGVIDPLLALRDPEKVWLKKSGEDFKEITPLCWSTPTLSMRNPVTMIHMGSGSIATDQIRRIYKVPNTSPVQWVIFATAVDEGGDPIPGRVVRIGPGLIDFKETDPLVRTSTEPLSLSVINDLLFSDASDISVCN